MPALSTGTNVPNRGSTLKCCLIAGVDYSAIVFRIQPNDPHNKNGSWAEKLFFDAVRASEEWVKNINMDSNVLPWFHHNNPQKNPKGYFVRLFIIRTLPPVPPKDSVIKLGKYICQQLENTPGNTTKVTLDEGNFFWLHQPTVWSDVIGCNAALAEIIRSKGQPHQGMYNVSIFTPFNYLRITNMHKGFFEAHQKYIHTFFHPNTLSAELARELRAPNRELHPSLVASAGVEELDLVGEEFCLGEDLDELADTDVEQNE